MKNLTLIALVLLSGTAFSQLRNFSASLGSNMNPIKTHSTFHSVKNEMPGYIEMPFYSNYEIKTSYDVKPGVSAAFSFEYGFSKKFYFASGLGFDWYRYDSQTRIILLDNPAIVQPLTIVPVGSPFGIIYGHQIDETGEPGTLKVIDLNNDGNHQSKSNSINAYYLSVPFMAGTSFFKQKLQVEAGLSANFLVRVTTMKTGYSFTRETSTVSNPWRPGEMMTVDTLIPHEYRYKDTDRSGYETFQLSSILRTTFNLNKHIGIMASGQLFLTSLYTDSVVKQKAISLGC